MPYLSDDEVHEFFQTNLALKAIPGGVGEGQTFEPEGAGRLIFPTGDYHTDVAGQFDPVRLDILYFKESQGELSALRADTPANKNNIATVEANAVRSIRKGNFTGLNVHGGALDGFRFNDPRASHADPVKHAYLLVYVDSQKWEMMWDNSNRVPMFVFQRRKDSKPGKPFEENWSFKQATRVNYGIGAGARIENYFSIDRNGQSIGRNQVVPYSFDIYVSIEVDDVSNPGNPTKHYFAIDPDGQNVGPP